MAMAKYLAVTPLPTGVRVHMIEHHAGTRNSVLQYFTSYNNGNMSQIDCVVGVKTVATLADANKVVEDEGPLVEMVTLRGNGWQSVIYEQAPKDSR